MMGTSFDNLAGVAAGQWGPSPRHDSAPVLLPAAIATVPSARARNTTVCDVSASSPDQRRPLRHRSGALTIRSGSGPLMKVIVVGTRPPD
jgi:hypothetical protein